MWLEDPDSQETKAFVDAQNEISVPYLQTETRNKFKQRYVYSLSIRRRSRIQFLFLRPLPPSSPLSMTKLFNFPKRGCPFRRGDKYYHYYNTGLQNHFALYQLDSLDGEPKLFLVRDLPSRSAAGLWVVADTLPLSSGPQHLVRGWHDGPEVGGLLQGWQEHGLQPLQVGLGLGHHPCS